MNRTEITWRGKDGKLTFAQGWSPKAQSRGVVCLVHGLGEHGGRYDRVACDFRDAGIATLAMDVRGHGRSEGKRGHVPSFELIHSEIAHLLEEARTRHFGAPIFLYGHSFGGAMVLHHALRSQEKLAGVIVSSPALRPAFEPPAWKTLLGKCLNHVWPSLALANELDVNEISSDPTVVRAYREDPLVHDRISVRLFNEWLAAVAEIFGRADEFPQPILLFHGSADKLTSAPATRELAGHLGSRCTFRLLEGCRHEPHNEPCKQDLQQWITAWMNERIETFKD
ncbi:MAG: alpha/beta hydrolase [Planctomycetota bacterium]